METRRQHARGAGNFVLLVAAFMALSGSVEADGNLSGDFPTQTALAVFVSYEGALPLPVRPGRLRLMVTDAMTEILEEGGHIVFTYPEIREQMKEWRVRRDGNISAQFLDALRARGAGRLAVARLIIYHDRMILLARVLSTDTGWLVWAGVEENESVASVTEEPDVQSWEGDLKHSCRRLLDGWQRRPPAREGEPLVVLPAEADGVEPAPTDTAVHCLLGALLARGRWSIPDPAIVASELWNAGHSPSRVDAESRSLLASRFGSRMLLVPRLVSFERSVVRPTTVIDEEDRPSVALDKDLKMPIHLSVAAVECSSGEAVFAAHRYIGPESPEGVFGVVRSIRLSRRLQRGVNEIVKELARRDGGR